MVPESQLSFIGDTRVVDVDEQSPSPWKLWVDGAARNNPGPAGAGIYLCKDTSVVARQGFFLGSRTNNQAEYLALLLGIFYFVRSTPPGDTIHIISDSQLLVRQMIGKYRVKNADLLRMQQCAFALLKGYTCYFFHVAREFNTEADKLANVGIDKRRYPPTEFVKLLQTYEITF